MIIIIIVSFDRMTEYSSNLMILLNDYLKTNKNVDAAFAALAALSHAAALSRAELIATAVLSAAIHCHI